jgi:hypothetical protein
MMAWPLAMAVLNISLRPSFRRDSSAALNDETARLIEEVAGAIKGYSDRPHALCYLGP